MRREWLAGNVLWQLHAVHLRLCGQSASGLRALRVNSGERFVVVVVSVLDLVVELVGHLPSSGLSGRNVELVSATAPVALRVFL